MEPATSPAILESKYGVLTNFINGSFTASRGGRSLAVISPLDGAPLADMYCSTAADLDAAVNAARAAYSGWSRTTRRRSTSLRRYTANKGMRRGPSRFSLKSAK